MRPEGSTGYRVDAERAYHMGLVQEVVPAGQALARALEIAQHLSHCRENNLLA